MMDANTTTEPRCTSAWFGPRFFCYSAKHDGGEDVCIYCGQPMVPLSKEQCDRVEKGWKMAMEKRAGLLTR